MGARSRNKGKGGERELARLLTAEGFPARRGVQYQGGPHSPDVVVECLPDVHIEVKRTERLRIYEAMNQAKRNAGGKMPIVAYRANDSAWLAILDLRDLLDILREAIPPRATP